MLKKVIFTILILGTIGGVIGYLMWNKPHKDIANTKEDFFISATDLSKEYNADETSANPKYLNKVIAVSGTVSEMQWENEEEPTVALSTGSEDNTVLCGFKKEFLNDIKHLKAGDSIKIKGKCDGINMFGGVVLTQCSLIIE